MLSYKMVRRRQLFSNSQLVSLGVVHQKFFVGPLSQRPNACKNANLLSIIQQASTYTEKNFGNDDITNQYHKISTH